MSNKSLLQLVLELRNRVAVLEAVKPQTDLVERFNKLEAQYRMLNARLSRKTINGEDPDRKRDQGST